ncbi:AI-2E family transporter [Candidatus Pacearchaeota archaeon]|nr:AI-2E family transporter [Candidatus Pacearchaeota archaeon]MBD3282740.1 AI-2E family transporter [Candidatus Pacearchaeota archaeon]
MIKKFLENKKLVASIVIIVLLIFILYSGIPFISAFFGALVLTFIFRPLNKYLKKNNLSQGFSAAIILIISLIVIIIPLIFLINGLINQITLLPAQIEKLKTFESRLNEIIPLEIELNEELLKNQVVPILTNAITPLFANIINAFAILFLLFFLLYYFVIYDEKIKDIIHDLLPFNEESKKRIFRKFKEITYATILGTFFIALIQGGLLALNFYLLGLPNALFWGFVTLILSFLPIVGAPIVWVPASLILLIGGSISKGIVLIVVGILISTVDNILRPIINERYGSIHPLISIIGIYIGIIQFGIIGIFIGPLLVAYLILFWELYNEEYMNKKSEIKSIRK